VNTASNKLGW